MRSLILSFAAFVIAACGGASDIVGASAPASVIVSVDVGSRVIVVGDSATFQVTVERSGGVAAPVSLDVSGLPAGVVSRLDAAQPTGELSFVTLTLVAAQDAVDSHATVTISVRDAGLKARSASIRLWVSSDSSAGSLKPRDAGWSGEGKGAE